MILTKSHLIEAIAEQNGFTSKKILKNSRNYPRNNQINSRIW